MHVRGIVVGKNDNIYAGWKEEEEEQSNTTVVEVAFSRVYYEWLIEFGWRGNEAVLN